MVDRVAAQQTFQNSRRFVRAVGGNNHARRFANGFLSRISIDALRSGVPRGNDSLEGFTGNSVIGTSDDGSQSAEVLFGFSPASDIADGAGNECSLLGIHWT